MNKKEILEYIYANKVVAVVRLNGDADAIEIARAIIKGGIKIIELTLTTPNADELIKELSQKFSNEALIGAGSVLDLDMAEKAIEAGAKYIVSPISNYELIEIAHSNDIPVMLGAYTPTEIYNAQKQGVDIVKVFPADGLGMSYFTSIKAPMPHLNIMPTGGVSLTNAGDWIKAGAAAVGIGSALTDKVAIKEKNYNKITINAEKIMESIKNIGGNK